MEKFSVINEAQAAKKKKIFLGGTCANSTWRNDLIKKLNINFLAQF